MSKLTVEEERLIRQKFPDLSDTELAILIRHSQQSGLDILGGQLTPQVYNKDNPNKRSMRFTVPIEAMRAIAARTTQWEGSTETFLLCRSKKAGELVEVPFRRYDPRDYSEVVSATVGVYRTGFREPRMGTALMSNYKKSGPGSEVWSKLPEHMLGLCAERIALRGAFPQDLGHYYGQEELPDDGEAGLRTAGSGAPAKPKNAPPPAILPKGVNTIKDVLDRLDKIFLATKADVETQTQAYDSIQVRFEVDDADQIPEEKIIELYAFIKNELTPQLRGAA